MVSSRLIDVGGYRLAVQVAGTGSPPVVFVSSLGSCGSEWDAVRAQLQVSTQTVVYDRPGLGVSDGLPDELRAVTQTYGDAAVELSALLAGARVPSSRVVVGFSIGALIVLAYASRRPAEVAGLVLVDATDADQWLELHDRRYRIDSERGWRWDFEPSRAEQAGLTVPAVPAVVVTSAVGRWLEAAKDYPSWPVADLDAHWQARQRRYAADLGAVQVIADSAGHQIPQEAPGLVAAAVDAAVSAVRSGGRAQIDPGRASKAGGYLA